MTETPVKGANPKTRSPEHPAVGLKEAVEKAQVFYKQESFNYAPVDVAKKYWGYGAKSSSGMRLLAALTHYGLLEDTGDGAHRRVRLTALAKAILLDKREDTRERDAALQHAALKPAIHTTLWRHWSGNLPSDASMEFELIRQFKFNPDSAKSFTKDFRATMAFANLLRSGKLNDTPDEEPEDDGGEDEDDSPPPPPPPAAHRQPEKVMPAVDSQGAQPYDLTLALMDGQYATIRVPRQMTKGNYDLLMALFNANLTAMRPALVSEPVQTGAANGPAQEAT